ncbi:hypothetical protein SpCBS45565_g01768 [Spizellomyces sp. 'palustris']|nr:hypothetical protein SpCBS45565_g01768 [Spizellomyces sp. 'palustris']
MSWWAAPLLLERFEEKHGKARECMTLPSGFPSAHTNSHMDTTAVHAILDHLLSNPDFYLKALRLSEEPPTAELQRTILSSTLERDKGLFLEKWGKFLGAQQLEFFQPFADQYEVKYYLNQYQSISRSLTKAQIRNRRINYLNQNLSNEYFSDDAFKDRDPALYEEYIGRYLPPLQAFPATMTLVDRIYSNMDRATHLETLGRHQEIEEEQFEEFDTDEEEDVQDTDEKKDLELKNIRATEVGTSIDLEATMAEAEDEGPISDAEKEALAEEFRKLMRLRFMDGEESEFEYSSVDNNAMYDLSDQSLQDDADAYFDSEEPSADADDDRSHPMEDFKGMGMGSHSVARDS